MANPNTAAEFLETLARQDREHHEHWYEEGEPHYDEAHPSELKWFAELREGLKAHTDVEKLRGLLGRVVKYVVEDRATTPGTTRLARLVGDIEEALRG